MSMIGNFLLVSDDTLRATLASPESVHTLLEAAHDQGGDTFVDVDKAWHCLHFLLTGTAWEGDPPLNFVVSGGTPVGEEDVGYGPARAFTSVELRSIADALDRIGSSDLPARFDGTRMEALEIYPNVGSWNEVDPTSEDSFGYFSGAFDAVKALARRGRASGLGLVVWLS
jgi:hypothetical protein